ncbi:hypothetical protein N7532_006026 [Penicillium argentinense]|uniref:Xylanolytic transcriptional activator regulatory domain-containing protein n=1 Tax=Penicillium argentinense TaxID=1131581 RepID=A0A9W9FFB0_9EURO|nr:uncharacterized protein N7532_006026 [Penicillium argentinense]KAJ5099025.1 hypothetical protein N7532_006026 [Penicillium argentinense]
MRDRALIKRRTTRGMTRKSGVLSTFPLDNLMTEVHRLLGPTWVLPPYNNLLPSFLKPPSPQLEQGDVDYLIRKGAFDVLEPHVAREFFKAYIRHVHPHVPFLNIDLFNALINGQRAASRFGGHREEKVSLLLFQAVMFSGAFFVDMHYLYAAGFLSRRNAMETLFGRARVLYDLDAEDDKLAVIQSLLLMTYWYDCPEKHKNGRHWIGVCVSLAYKAELHLDYSGHPDWNFRKVLWWSIFTRDRLISLGLQQPPIIKEQLESAVPTIKLGEDDLVTPGLRPNIGPIYYGEHHTKLAQIFVEKIKLVSCIKDDLFSWSQSTKATSYASQPRRSCLWLSKLELEDWLRELPSGISFRSIPFVTNQTDLLLYSHCAWLKMVYLEIHSTLHRQLDFLSEQYSPRQQLSLDAPDCPVLVSAIDFTAIIQDLYEKHLISYLPTTSVPMILRTGIIHIQEAFASSSATWTKIRIGSFCRFAVWCTEWKLGCYCVA